MKLHTINLLWDILVPTFTNYCAAKLPVPPLKGNGKGSGFI